MKEKYVICYLINNVQDGIEEPMKLKEAIERSKMGIKRNYYCSLFESKEEAEEAYRSYEETAGEDTELIKWFEYGFVYTLEKLEV